MVWVFAILFGLTELRWGGFAGGFSLKKGIEEMSFPESAFCGVGGL